MAPMHVVLREEPLAALPAHARIPIAFLVDRVLDLGSVAVGAGAGTLAEIAIPTPYLKDYDAIPGNHPTTWPSRFDMSQWGLIGAFAGETRVGGAVVARDTPGLELLRGDPQRALLWDLRVAPDHRGQGIGSLLFTGAEHWARGRGCQRLHVETQDINPAACRFYANRGCYLERVVRSAYPGFPNEVQLIWTRSLAGAAPFPA